MRGDGIVAISGTLDGATVALLEHLVGPTREIVTVIEGADATGGHQGQVHPLADRELPLLRGLVVMPLGAAAEGGPESGIEIDFGQAWSSTRGPG